MESMKLFGTRCQAVPNFEKGIVIGLDISKDTITYRACRPEGATKAFVVDQDMQGFRKIEAALQQYKAQGYEVWVGYEPTGAYSCCIFDYLEEQGWKVVQINPKHTSRYNDIMDNVPGKSDPRDPRGISGLIWQGCYRTPLHLKGTYAELRVASAEWATLTREGTRLRNQLHSLMELWCPEMRMVFKDVLCKSARALAYKYSSTDAIVSAGLSRVKKVLHKASRGTTADRAQTLLDVVCQSKALRSGQKARHRSILNHLARLEMIEEQKETLKADMEQMLSLLPESRRLISVKGIGVVISAIILGECGNIGDYDEKQLEKLLGLNLCEFSSGKYKGKRKISKCGRAAVRYALCLAATRMAGKGGIYQDVAERMRAGGKNFGQIRIAVARKLLRLLHSLVKNDEDFDLQRFVARRRTGDDLLAHQDSQPLSAA
jgi:transposase